MHSSFQSKKKPRPPRFYTPEQWKKFIEEWKQSGMGQKPFCKQKGLTSSAFHRWKQILDSSGDEIKNKKPATQQSTPPKPSFQNQFIPVTVTSSPISNPSSPKMEIVFANGHRLYLQGPFDWQALSSWLSPLLGR